MKQGKIGMSFRHAPGKLLVVGRFLEKIVSALLPFLTMLDEPTAAIDPVEESAVYEKFLQMVKGKTAVIVTHRLASARLADRILVMEKGRIAEAGTHEELLAAGGLYSRMWKAQAESYQG